MDLEKFQGMWGYKNEAGEEIWFTPLNKKLLSGKRWASLKYRFSPLHYWAIKYIKEYCNSKKNPLILDFGCGTGSETIHISSCVGQPIIGYDIFPTQISIANHFAKQSNTGCRFSSIHDGSIPHDEDSIDLIYSSHVLGHIENIPEALKEWFRVLKPGGGHFQMENS